MEIKNKKGNTLLEILLYIGIASAVLTTASIFFVLMLKTRVENETAAEVEQQGIQAMYVISQAARDAQGINSPLAGSSAGSLSLAMADSGKNPTIIDLSGGAIRIKEGSDPVVPLTSPDIVVSNINFSNVSGIGTKGSIKIQFTLSHANPEGRQEYDYQKTFYGSASLR